jgi:prophage regulatory protein
VSVLRLPAVRQATGLSRSVIYDLMSRDEFPMSIRLGARSVGWIGAEIAEWVARRPRRRAAPAKAGEARQR